MKKILLKVDHPVISKITGTDTDGLTWSSFLVDQLAEQLPGVCSICNAEIEDGFLCLDGGDEVCTKYIDFINPQEEEKLRQKDLRQHRMYQDEDLNYTGNR